MGRVWWSADWPGVQSDFGAMSRRVNEATPQAATRPAAVLYGVSMKGRVTVNCCHRSRLTSRNLLPHSASGVVCKL